MSMPLTRGIRIVLASPLGVLLLAAPVIAPQSAAAEPQSARAAAVAPPTTAAVPQSAPAGPQFAPAAAAGPCGVTPGAAASYSHVIWVWMENHSYPDVIGPPGSAAYANAPFVNAMAAQCGLATNYHNVSHPSLPNYLGAVAGSTLGVTTDCSPSSCPQSATSIFGQLQAARLPWRAYDESMPANCYRAISGLYAPKHNPAVYFRDAAAACPGSDLPLGTTTSGAFRTALLTNTLPAFSFVTPNLCNDMHNCPISTGDAWLRSWLPVVVASPAYRSGTTALVVTWDEGGGGSTSACATNTVDVGCHVATLVISPSTAFGARSATLFNHYSLLRTTEQLLGLPLLGYAGSSTSMAVPFGLDAVYAGPALAASGGGRLDLVDRSFTGGLEYSSRSATGGWGPLLQLGGRLLYSPAVASPGTGQLFAFVTGTDQQLWERWTAGGGWSAWIPLGGRLTSGPAAVSWGSGRIDVFGRGTNAVLYHRFWTPAGWSGWESPGGGLAAGPAVASTGPDRLTVVARGMDGAVWVQQWTGRAWTGWSSIGGNTTAAPAVSVGAGGALDVFVRGTDGALYHRAELAGRWTGWQGLGGVLSSGPAAAHDGTTTLVVVTGRNGHLYQLSYRPGSISSWSLLR